MRPIRRPPQEVGTGSGEARVRQTVESGVLVVEVALPGVDPVDDLDVTIGGGWLHVYAERYVACPPRGGQRHEHRLSTGAFAASVPLPAGVVEARVEAVYRAGTLEVRIPFDLSAPAPTTIPVTVA
jgi:HSP20 family protein